jgi:hypothetical protein
VVTVRNEASQVSPWRKSSFSGMGDCVEVRSTSTGIEVRDSKHPSGTVLAVRTSAWRTFAASASAGELTTQGTHVC